MLHGGCFAQGLNGSVLTLCNDSSHTRGPVYSAREMRKEFDSRTEWLEAVYASGDIEPVYNGYGW